MKNYHFYELTTSNTFIEKTGYLSRYFQNLSCWGDKATRIIFGNKNHLIKGLILIFCLLVSLSSFASEASSKDAATSSHELLSSDSNGDDIIETSSSFFAGKSNLLPPCPNSPFDGGQISNNSSCFIQNISPAYFDGSDIEYVWLKSTLPGDCSVNILELAAINVGAAYNTFLANGGFGGANANIGNSSWMFTTDFNADDLTYDASGINMSTCFYRCSRVVGCERFWGETGIRLDPCTAPNPDCELIVNAGPDQDLCNGSATLNASVSEASNCGCDFNLPLAYWSLFGCNAVPNYQPTIYEDFCSGISGSQFLTLSLAYDIFNPGIDYYFSCVVPGAGSQNGLCHPFVPSNEVTETSDKFIFSLDVDPSSGEQTCLSELSFYLALSTFADSADPDSVAIRVKANGTLIFDERRDVTQTTDWNKEIFSLINDADFCVSDFTTFDFEIIPYIWTGGSGRYILEIDEIKISGGCCEAPVASDVSYLWSTGQTTQSIVTNQPGTYSVTATDCNECVAVDQVVVTACDPCINQGGDSDGDGVCNNQDCQPNNAAFPATPGSSCNDGNPNTTNDVVTNDGCGCAGTPTGPPCSVTTGTCSITINGGSGGDYFKVFDSNWNIIWDCNPWGNNPCSSTAVITNLENGIYHVQACGVTEPYTVSGCTTDPCAGQGGDSDGDGVCNNQDCQPNNAAFPATPGSSCNDGDPNTTNDVVTTDGCGCAGTQTGTNCNVTVDDCSIIITGLDGSDYSKVFDSNWNIIWDCNPWGNNPCSSTAVITDLENGIYHVQACGVTEPYTVSGCTTDPCAGQGGDSDGDGVCDNQDCQPNNAAFPATPGTPCNDGNPTTNNDVVQADGCSCEGEGPQNCVLEVNAGSDKNLCNGPVTLSATATGATDCNTTCPSNVLAYWSFNDCQVGGNGGLNNTPMPPTESNNQLCGFFNVSGFKTQNFAAAPADNMEIDWRNYYFSCQNDAISGELFNSVCHPFSGSLTAGLDDLDKFMFSVSLEPQNGQQGCLTELSFYENVSISSQVSSPQMAAIRVKANGVEIFDERISISGGIRNWLLALFDFTDNDSFCVTENTTFDFEIIPYDWSDTTYPPTFYIWEIDEVTVKGGCCDITTETEYNWSLNGTTVSTDASFVATSPGTYLVTATDCDECVAVDQVVVSACDPCINQGGDSDGDGVCNNQDCQPNNAAFPATPGSSCNDGDPNTTNDVVTNDGCGCAGTPIGTTCNVTVDGCSITITGLDGSDYSKVFDSNWNIIWDCNPWGNNVCNETEVITDLENGIYHVQACGVTESYTLSGCTTDPCAGQGGDSDGDGVCNNQDCQPNNAAFPATPGSSCNDGDPNTTNDVVTNDGCGCAGTPIGTTCNVTVDGCSITITGLDASDYSKVFDSNWNIIWDCNPWGNNVCNETEVITDLENGIYHVQACGVTESYTISGCTNDPCAGQGGDSDGDGVCDNQDCQPNNSAFPATPGTPCNDGNPNTENDVVTNDGCGCQGVISNPGCDLVVNAGPDKDLCNGSATLTASVSGESDCVTFSNSSIVAKWDLDVCDLNDTGNGQAANFDEFTAMTTDLSCASINASNLFRESGGHSCVDGLGFTGICAAIGTNQNSLNWQDDSPLALRFGVDFNSTSGNLNRFNELQFFVLTSTDEPFRYGFRILKNGIEVYQEIDLVLAPSTGWELISRDFTNNPAFTTSGNASYEVEILWYVAAGQTSMDDALVFDIADIKIFGSCSNNTQSAVAYLWSTGQTTQSIVTTQPGTYSVTATDCNGCVDIDQVVVSACNPCAGQGGDSDGDGVCNNQDCQPNNAAFPATPGSSCNDGDPNTTNDVVTNDGCGCAGTPIGTTCNVTVDGCSITITGLDGSDYSKVFDSNWNIIWDCNPWGNNVCNETEVITDLENGIYHVQACGVTESYTLSGCTTDPCAGQGGDSDGDGVCDNQDCQPNNSAFPATPGTPCNDGNSNTENDIVTNDGCDCQGVISNPDCELTVNAGPDQDLCNGSATLNASVSGESVCTNFSNSSIVAHWTLDNCDINDYTQSQAANFDEFTAQTTNISCANISATNLFRNLGSHSCFDRFGQSGLCAGLDPSEISSVFQADSPFAFRFGVDFNSTNGINRFDKLELIISGGFQSFYNPDIINYGFRILKNGVDIYQEIDLELEIDTQIMDFELVSLDFSDNPAFISSEDASYEIELIWYSNPYQLVFFEIADIKAFGSCSTNTQSDVSYSWSTGETTPSIFTNQAGTYDVTVTDCEGCIAVDQVVVTACNPCVNQGGDSDGDGVCNNVDLCEGGDDNMDNDGDGIPNFCDDTPNGGGDPCDAISIVAGDGIITVSNLDAPIFTVLVFNAQWQTVYNCGFNCEDPSIATGLPDGEYHVSVKLYDSSWDQICSIMETVVLGSSGSGYYSESDEIFDFQAHKNGREVRTYWMTNRDYNNDHFILERSLDGTNFEEIKNVSSITNSTGAYNYFESDVDPYLGVNFYRLTKVHHDGSILYSVVRRVVFDLDLSETAIFPNPAANEVYVDLQEFEGRSATISIFNYLGQRMDFKAIDVIEPSPIRFELSKYTSGAYTMYINMDGTKNFSRMFIISKL